MPNKDVVGVWGSRSWIIKTICNSQNIRVDSGRGYIPLLPSSWDCFFCYYYYYKIKYLNFFSSRIIKTFCNGQNIRVNGGRGYIPLLP